MKAIKTLLAASALATIAGAANATVWDMTATENTFFGGAQGPLIINMSGTYDDVAKTSSLHGTVNIPGFATDIAYSNFVITMDPATGKGAVVKPDSSASNCTSNTTSGCPGFSQALQGPIYNAINFSYTDLLGNQINTSTGTPFSVPAGGGVYTWTAVFSVPENGLIVAYQLPFTVTLTPQVPVPAAAWLFGSGLLGLAGTARRRRSA